jgi:ketosteroid isomerase-like protein
MKLWPGFGPFAALAITLGIVARTGAASPADDAKAVADLDTQYQKAVKENDAATMSRILLDDFVLVVGNGSTFNKSNLLEDAKSKRFDYEKQDEMEGTQKVRVWGDTAVVTALLWIKAKDAKGAQQDRKLWFSDTYVRTKDGWRYAFGQASLALPRSE